MIDSLLRDNVAYIKHLLAESPLAEVRKVRVECEGNRLFLQGRVRSFYAKQMAQETIRTAAKGLQIINSVNVE